MKKPYNPVLRRDYGLMSLEEVDEATQTTYLALLHHVAGVAGLEDGELELIGALARSIGVSEAVLEAASAMTVDSQNLSDLCATLSGVES